MKVLVFGGLGFMGANFVNWTRRNRPEVEIRIADAFTYAADPARLDCPESIDIHRANLMYPDQYRSLLKWCDLVINFAAETHNDNSLERPLDFYESNVLGVVHLMQGCIASDKPLVQVSTDEVYGDFPLDSDELATEEHPFRPSSPYSASKAAGDLAVMAWVRSFGLRAIVTHCTNNFGPKQNKEKFIPNVISRVRLGVPIRIFGSGLNVRDWIHVDDHTEALWTLLDAEKWNEVFNISAGNQMTNLEVVRQILTALDLPSHPVHHVRDRAGHDLKYALDSSKMRSLGWQPKRTNFSEELPLQ